MTRILFCAALFGVFLLFFFFMIWISLISTFFFFNDTAPPEIYPLSLHDPLPIYPPVRLRCLAAAGACSRCGCPSAFSRLRPQPSWWCSLPAEASQPPPPAGTPMPAPGKIGRAHV